MGRPEVEKKVGEPPLFDVYKPAGVRASELGTVELSLDEYEAIKLADYNGLEHAEAAIKMGIARPTFTKLITRARTNFSKLLVEGAVVTIAGGKVHFQMNRYKCSNCGKISAVEVNEELKKCPYCDSLDIESLAQRFGHGRCCGKN